MSRDAAYLRDVLRAAELVVQFTRSLPDRAALDHDLMCQSALMRQLEIMGEAPKRLSQSFRDAHSEVPWADIAGMRDVLIHGYDYVDLDIVWDTVQVGVPEVLAALRLLVPGAAE